MNHARLPKTFATPQEIFTIPQVFEQDVVIAGKLYRRDPHLEAFLQNTLEFGVAAAYVENTNRKRAVKTGELTHLRNVDVLLYFQNRKILRMASSTWIELDP